MEYLAGYTRYGVGKSEDPENPNIYEGTLTFEITEQMMCWASLQLFCSYDDVADDISIDFHTN